MKHKQIGVPMTYTFEATLTDGSPLTAKIYDEEGNAESTYYRAV